MTDNNSLVALAKTVERLGSKRRKVMDAYSAKIREIENELTAARTALHEANKKSGEAGDA